MNGREGYHFSHVAEAEVRYRLQVLGGGRWVLIVWLGVAASCRWEGFGALVFPIAKGDNIDKDERERRMESGGVRETSFHYNGVSRGLVRWGTAGCVGGRLTSGLT